MRPRWGGRSEGAPFAPEGGDGAVGIEGADIGKGSIAFMDSIVLGCGSIKGKRSMEGS